MNHQLTEKVNLSEAAAAFRFAGELLPRSYIADRVVDVVVRVDDLEARRRRELDIAPVDDMDVLQELARLPHNVDVPTSALDDFAVTLLRTLPEGIVDWPLGNVRRLWRPALTISGFVVTTSNWRRGLKRVSLFAADAPRAIVYTGKAGISKLTSEARVVGVGVGLASSNRVSVILEPNRRLALAGVPQWLLAEDLFMRYSAIH